MSVVDRKRSSVKKSVSQRASQRTSVSQRKSLSQRPPEDSRQESKRSLWSQEGLSDSSDSTSESSSSQSSEGEPPQTSLLVESLTAKWKSYTEKMVVEIIEARADVNSRLMAPWDPMLPDFSHTLGATALHFAARRGLLEVCTALLEHRAVVNMQSSSGTTPLMAAVILGHTASIQLLGEARANTAVRDLDGCTAIDLAILEGRPNIVEQLFDLEAGDMQADLEMVEEAASRTVETLPASFDRIMEKRRNSIGLGSLPASPRSQASPRSKPHFGVDKRIDGSLMRSIVEDFGSAEGRSIAAAPVDQRRAVRMTALAQAFAQTDLEQLQGAGSSSASRFARQPTGPTSPTAGELSRKSTFVKEAAAAALSRKSTAYLSEREPAATTSRKSVKPA